MEGHLLDSREQDFQQAAQNLIAGSRDFHHRLRKIEMLPCSCFQRLESRSRLDLIHKGVPHPRLCHILPKDFRDAQCAPEYNLYF